MLKVKSIALQITNLSDARYFSAYGVDWMAFPSSQEADNIATIKEIVEWVEGPQIAIEMEEWDPTYYRFFGEQIEVDGLVLWNDAPHATDKQKITILSLDQLTEGMKIDNETTFLDTRTIEKDQILEVVKAHPGLGVALFGSHEEQVGFKSFEEQDDIIELLLD